MKANDVGIGKLDRCRIVGVEGPRRWLAAYDDVVWPIEYVFWSGHVAAVTVIGTRVRWRAFDADGRAVPDLVTHNGEP